MNDGAKEIKDPMVAVALDQQKKTVESLTAITERLSSKLNPILRREPGTEGPGPAKENVPQIIVPLVSDINEITANISIVSGRLERLLKLCEV